MIQLDMLLCDVIKLEYVRSVRSGVLYPTPFAIKKLSIGGRTLVSMVIHLLPFEMFTEKWGSIHVVDYLESEE